MAMLLFLREYKEDNALKELIKYMAQAMVDHPEQVEVSEVEGNRVSVLELIAFPLGHHYRAMLGWQC
jgi:hypothetical protein